MVGQKRSWQPGEPASQPKHQGLGSAGKAIAGSKSQGATATGSSDERSFKLRRLLGDGEGKQEESLR